MAWPQVNTGRVTPSRHAQHLIATAVHPGTRDCRCTDRLLGRPLGMIALRLPDRYKRRISTIESSRGTLGGR
jgi:hypothetical protein